MARRRSTPPNGDENSPQQMAAQWKATSQKLEVAHPTLFSARCKATVILGLMSPTPPA